MAKKNNSALFFLCSLIEYIGRTMRLKRKDVVDKMGKDTLEHIYNYADILHCEPMEKVAYEFIQQCGLIKGNYDNVSECRYKVPDYWAIGQVYERLIEDCFDEEELIQGLSAVYSSWISDSISDYNTDFYYQSRDYISACYREGEIL